MCLIKLKKVVGISRNQKQVIDKTKPSKNNIYVSILLYVVRDDLICICFIFLLIFLHSVVRGGAVA